MTFTVGEKYTWGSSVFEIVEIRISTDIGAHIIWRNDDGKIVHPNWPYEVTALQTAIDNGFCRRVGDGIPIKKNFVRHTLVRHQ